MPRWIGTLSVVLALFWGDACQAQDSATVRLGFLLNFARYVEWPESVWQTNVPLRICLAPGDSAMAEKADELKKQMVQGHAIQVRLVIRPEDAGNCQIVYLPADLPAATLTNWMGAVAGVPMLTVSESPDFIEAGGIIGLVPVGSRYRFDVNLGNARRAGLRVSSYLLKLARTVR